MTNDYVANPEQRVLQVIAGLAAHHGKMWCYPSYTTIKRILLSRYHYALSERSLARHIGALVQMGYLDRQRRHKRAKDGSLELHSTLYVIKQKAVAALGQLSRFLAFVKTKPWAERWIKPLISATFSTADSGSKWVQTQDINRKKDKNAQDSRKRE